MREFKDKNGTSWDVEITVATVKRVRDLIGVNLAQMAEETMLSLADDPIMLCDVMYAVCKPQADERAVSDEDFGRLLRGESIDEATKALLEDLGDFFRNAARRKLWATAIARMREIEETGIRVLQERLDDREILERARARIAAELGVMTSSPTPTGSPE